MKLLKVCVFLFVAGCSNYQPNTIELKATNGSLDLQQVIPGDWDRVCVLMPYATHFIAKEFLGIDYNVYEVSNIYHSDSIAHLVVFKKGQIVGSYDASRKNVDLTSLGQSCFQRQFARFKVVDRKATLYDE